GLGVLDGLGSSRCPAQHSAENFPHSRCGLGRNRRSRSPLSLHQQLTMRVERTDQIRASAFRKLLESDLQEHQEHAVVMLISIPTTRILQSTLRAIAEGIGVASAEVSTGGDIAGFAMAAIDRRMG
ncbi:unnamed protein product, partial [Ectocarpus sp. 13 AM-2016]